MSAIWKVRLCLIFSVLLCSTMIERAVRGGDKDDASILLVPVARAETIQVLPEYPTQGPGEYRLVLQTALSEACSLPEEARWYYLGLIRTESNFAHFNSDGTVIINEIGAVGISQLYTRLMDQTAPYPFSDEVLDLNYNVLQGCRHFRSDWEMTDGDPRLAIARYKGFFSDPSHSYVSQALCFAETQLTGSCLRD